MDPAINSRTPTDKIPAHFHSLGSKPGATNTATVNLVTGNVSFPDNLISLPGRNGFDFDLAIIYIFS